MMTTIMIMNTVTDRQTDSPCNSASTTPTSPGGRGGSEAKTRDNDNGEITIMVMIMEMIGVCVRSATADNERVWWRE